MLFYGPGAGAGPTASAVVGDLAQIMRSGTKTATPVFEKSECNSELRESYKQQSYLAFRGACPKCVEAAFGKVAEIEAEDEQAFLTRPMTDTEVDEAIAKLTQNGAELLSRIRVL